MLNELKFALKLQCKRNDIICQAKIAELLEFIETLEQAARQERVRSMDFPNMKSRTRWPNMDRMEFHCSFFQLCD